MRIRMVLIVMVSLALAGCQEEPPCEVGEPCVIGFTTDVTSVVATGVTVTSVLEELDAAVIEASNQDQLDDLRGQTRYMEPDFEVSLIEPVEVAEVSLVQQWHIAKVRARDAWEITQGEGVIVAVLDTGTDCTHPDLAVSCVAGRTYHDKDQGPGKDGDDHGHGTHVAGLVGANGEATGTAPQVLLMPVQVLSAGGFGNNSDIAAGIVWSSMSGAQIINLSLGSSRESQLMQDAVDVAIERGTVVIAARGNGGGTAPHYPACTDGVIAVTATDSNDQLASWSSRGDCGNTLVAAPGHNVTSTRDGGGYTSMSGTSMASPVTAGIAALGIAAGVEDVAAHLARTADDIGNRFAGPRVNAWRMVDGRVPPGPIFPTITPVPPQPTRTPTEDPYGPPVTETPTATPTLPFGSPTPTSPSEPDLSGCRKEDLRVRTGLWSSVRRTFVVCPTP